MLSKPPDAARLTTNYDAAARGDNAAAAAAPDPKLPPGFQVADDRRETAVGPAKFGEQRWVVRMVRHEPLVKVARCL